MWRLLVVVGALLGTIAASVTSHAQDVPAIEVDPPAAAPGDVGTVKGSGFGPGTVEIHIDEVRVGEALGTVPVGRDGTFTIRVVIPRIDAGDHRIVACRDPLRTGECRETAVAPITIVPPPTTSGPTTTTTTAPPSTAPPRTTTTTAPRAPTTTTTTVRTPPSTHASTTTPPPPRTAPATSTTPPRPATTPSSTTAATTTAATTTTPPAVTITPAEPPLAVATTTSTTDAGQLAAEIPVGPDPTFDPTPDQFAVQTTVATADDFAAGGTDDVDIELTHIEVTQGLQNLANDFPLVAERPTAVRVFGVMHGDSQSLASAFLEVSRNGAVLDIIEAENNPVQFTDTLVRGSNDAAPFFLLDNEYLEGTLTLRAQAIAGDPTMANDTNPADNFIQTTVTFHEATPFTVHAFPLYLGEDGTSSGTPLAIHTASDGWIEQALAFYRLWPLGRFTFDPFNPTVGDADSGWDMSVEEGGGEPFAALAAVHAANGYGPKELTMGMVSPDADVYWGGFAQVPGPVSWSKMQSGYSATYPWHHRSGYIIAQELAHSTGLSHAPCEFIPGEPEPGELHGGGIDPLFPQSYSWPNCSIGPTDIEGYYGFDVMYQITGTAEPSIMSNNPAVSPPFNAAPFMSYKGIGKWLEPWHGCALLTWLGVPCTQTDLIPIDDDVPGQGQGLPPVGHAVPVWTCDGWNGPGNEEGDLCDLAFDQPFDPTALEDVDEGLLVIATIDPDTGIADLTAGNTTPDLLSELLQYDGIDGESEGRAPAPWTLYDYDGDDYLLLVRDGSGRVIGVQTLDVRSANGHDDADVDADATGDDVGPNPLLDRDHGHGVATLAVRIPALAGAASLEIVTEDGVLASLRPGARSPVIESFAVDVDADVARLSWDAGDPDGDALALLVQYRGGDEWRTVGQPVGSSIDVSLDMLPGSEGGEFRLLASDGLHQTLAVSEPVSLPDRTPFAAVLSPPEGATRAAGRSVELRGSGIDLEDRDGVTFSWASDLDGDLGTGDRISVASLREGRHTITMSVTDSAGNVGTHSVGIEITPSDLAPAEVLEQVERVFRDGPPAPEPRDSSGPWLAVVGVLGLIVVAGGAAWQIGRRRTATEPVA